MKRLVAVLCLLAASVAWAGAGPGSKVILPEPGDIRIDGPSESVVGQEVTLRLIGLPPVDSTGTIEDATEWFGTLEISLDLPPELVDDVPVVLTPQIVVSPTIYARCDIQFTPPANGDYVLVVGWNYEVQKQLTHRVRADEGPNPPPVEPVLAVEPSDILNATGEQGGPFTPSSITYALANIGTGDLAWTNESSQTWVTASPASGTLAAGKMVEVVVTIGPDANGLAAGLHAGLVTFRNSVNGNGDTFRAVVLVVGGDVPPPPPPPPPTELWGVLIYKGLPDTTDDPEQWARWAQVMTSPRVQDLFGKGHLRKAERDDTATDTLQTWIDEAKGKPLPYLMLFDQSGNDCWAGQLPETIDEAVKLIEQYKPAAERPTAGKAARVLVFKPRQPTGYRTECTGDSCRLVPIYEREKHADLSGETRLAP